jgi:hypothetical protein
MDFTKVMDSKRSPSFTAAQQSGNDLPAGSEPSVSTPVPDDKPAPQSVSIPAPVTDSRPVIVAPSAESLKSHGDVPIGHEPTVSPGNILPQDQGVAQAPPSEPALTARGSISIIDPAPQSEPGGTSAGKASRNFEEESVKTDRSIQEQKASPPAYSKTVNGKAAGPSGQTLQGRDKPMRRQEPSDPAGTPASKPGTDSEEDPHDPDKLMDWFMNKRGR